MEVDANPWVEQLVREQRPDGGWGRFHSRDTTARGKVLTTEFGVERGLALGLEPNHRSASLVVDYLARLLGGQADFPDPAERNDRWSVGVELFTAATLARLRPRHPLLDSPWESWAEIATRAFRNGDYDRAAEIQAHRDLTGATVKDSYLILNNKYSLTLLSARVDDLPKTLTARIVSWVWSHPRGIGYLGVSPSEWPDAARPSVIDRWFSTHEVLSRFPPWREMSGELVDWLWAERGDDGFWDFGPRAAGSHYFPLSPNWRKPIRRKADWSTRTLVLLSQATSPTP